MTKLDKYLIAYFRYCHITFLGTYLTQDYFIKKGQKSSHQITKKVRNIIIIAQSGACKQNKGGNSLVFSPFFLV